MRVHMQVYVHKYAIHVDWAEFVLKTQRSWEKNMRNQLMTSDTHTHIHFCWSIVP